MSPNNVKGPSPTPVRRAVAVLAIVTAALLLPPMRCAATTTGSGVTLAWARRNTLP